MVKFSLLMCVYEKENPQHLKECLKSIEALSIKPDEFVIVKDGPLTDDLEAILEMEKGQGEMGPSPCPFFNIIALPENVTSGPARAAGLEAASNEWVAIIDSDDICRPDRFEKQLKMIEQNPKLGLIGGQIAEFIDDPNKHIATRTVPQEHDKIVKYAKTRSPFNQMTVMVKKSEVQKAGSYRLFPLFEDYDLWTRMIKNGTICANHPDVLVDARVGSGMYKRRRGVKYIRSEWKMQKQLKKLGFIGLCGFLKNVLLRIPVRLLPGKLLAGVYRGFAR